MSAETIGDIGFTGDDNKSGLGPGGGPNIRPDVDREEPKLPPIIKYKSPSFYAPFASQLQRAAYDPRSTSHRYVARFGYAKEF